LDGIFWLDGYWFDDLPSVWLSPQQIEEKYLV
jgi:hypothetical protein